MLAELDGQNAVQLNKEPLGRVTRNVMHNTKHVSCPHRTLKRVTDIRGISLAVVVTLTNLRMTQWRSSFMAASLPLIIGAGSVAAGPVAQREPPSQVWGERFAAAIRSSFPGAQLQPRRLPPRERGDGQRWDYQGAEIYLVFTELESDREALEFLKQRTEILPQPRRPVSEFGDEAFLFYPGATVRRRMNLRRHNMVLEIGAPGEIALSRLALALVDVIDKVTSR